VRGNLVPVQGRDAVGKFRPEDGGTGHRRDDLHELRVERREGVAGEERSAAGRRVADDGFGHRGLQSQHRREGRVTRRRRRRGVRRDAGRGERRSGGATTATSNRRRTRHRRNDLHVSSSKKRRLETVSLPDRRVALKILFPFLYFFPTARSNCAKSVEKAILDLNTAAGKKIIIDVSVSATTDTAKIEYYDDGDSAAAPPPTTLDRIKEAVDGVGYSVDGVELVQRKDLVSEAESDPAVSSHGDWEQLQERQERKVRDRKHAFLFSLIGTVPILSITMVLPFLFPQLLVPLNQTISFQLVRPIPHVVTLETLLLWILATPVQFGSGYEFYRMSYHGLKNGRAGMDLLIALGTTASYIYALYGGIWEGVQTQQDGTGDNDASMASHFFETAVTLISFVLAGKWMQALAVRRTSQALSKLMQLQAKTAVKVTPVDSKKEKQLDEFDPLKDAYNEATVPIEQVLKGDMVKILRGASIPADGRVVAGEISVDESMVTGESVPVLKTDGSVVLGGTVCVEASASGAAFVKVTGVGSSTALAQIVQLVQDAQTRSVPIQSFADQIAAIFVPSVCAVSVVTFAVWYVLCGIGIVPAEWYQSLGEDSLTFSIMFGIACLVISCPCALGLATPTAVMVRIQIDFRPPGIVCLDRVPGLHYAHENISFVATGWHWCRSQQRCAHERR